MWLLIHYEVANSSIADQINVIERPHSWTFYNPCNSIFDCTPYIVDFSPGLYRIESWGYVSGWWNAPRGRSYPGLGGYSSGIISFNETKKLYFYIGKIGYFNAVNGTKYAVLPGGATDVRLVYNENWWDEVSLRSRILVAGGGGSAEWPINIGGHGGGLEGGSAIFEGAFAGGGTQFHGGYIFNCAPDIPAIMNGSFGMSHTLDGTTDGGGTGGGGYYGGASMDYTGVGGGGSSFISGHPGCIALENEFSNTPSKTNSSIHYSNLIFIDTVMIQGNNEMPLPNIPRKYKSIGNANAGAIRVTVLNYPPESCRIRCTQYSTFIIYVFIFILSE